MLRIYKQVISGGTLKKQLPQLQIRLGAITQQKRNYAGGLYKLSEKSESRLSCSVLNLFFVVLFFIIFLGIKSKFQISDEVLDGRPLYLDAQATTPLVSIIHRKT